MRACAVGLILALAGGCATPPAVKDETSPQPGLTADEYTFAKALAHYGQGLLDENTHGITSDESVQQLSAAAELDPAQHRIHSRLAVKALLRGDTDAAIAELQRSTEADPDSLLAWLDLARTYQINGQLDDAIRTYRRALGLAPDNDHIRAAIVGLLFEQLKDEQALRMIRAGLDSGASAEAPLAVACHKQGRKFIAAKESERAIPCFELLRRKLPPDTHQYDYLLAEIYRTNDRPAEAMRAYRRATELSAPLPEAFLKLALIQVGDNPEAALVTLERGARALPDSALLLITLASLYAQQGRDADGVKYYRQVYDIASRDASTALKASFYLSFGAALERSGRRDEAVRIFREGIETHPATPQMLNYVAYMWAEDGENLAEAEAYALEALEIHPDNGAYLDTLGWIYFRQGKFEAALQKLLEARDEMPRDPTIHEHIGDAYIALGQRKHAIEEWTRGLRLDPKSQSLVDRLRAQGLDGRPLLETQNAAGNQS